MTAASGTHLASSVSTKWTNYLIFEENDIVQSRLDGTLQVNPQILEHYPSKQFKLQPNFQVQCCNEVPFTVEMVNEQPELPDSTASDFWLRILEHDKGLAIICQNNAERRAEKEGTPGLCGVQFRGHLFPCAGHDHAEWPVFQDNDLNSSHSAVFQKLEIWRRNWEKIREISDGQVRQK